MNRLPPELHIVQGSVQTHKGTTLPDRIRQRIPKADWFDNPEAWDADKFIRETSDFLWDSYGIGADQHKHILAACAAQLEIYIQSRIGLKKTGLLAKIKEGKIGKSPYLEIGDRALMRATMLMNDMGLTPRGQLTSTKQEGGKYADFLAGP